MNNDAKEKQKDDEKQREPVNAVWRNVRQRLDNENCVAAVNDQQINNLQKKRI